MAGSFGPGRSGDEGFTLIELLVYMSLATIVLVIVGGFMVSSLEVERDVTSVAEATSTGQLISTSIQAAVRNGSGARIETALSGDQMLIALTSPIGGTGDPVCQAWFYSALDKAVYTKISPMPGLAVAWPASTPAGSWTLLGSGIESVEPPEPTDPATYVFGPATVPTATEHGIGSGTDSVSLTFEVAAGARDSVRIETTVYTRTKTIVGGPCFP